MKLIKPNEISSKIMTLIEESDEFVVLVTPYVKISKWYKLIKKIDALKARKIPIDFVIRDDEKNHNSFTELNKLNYKFKAIEDLHSKLYINEKYAIVTSMNLLLSSEINSLEIGYMTETNQEHNELIDYCKRHLSIDFSDNRNYQLIDDYTKYISDTLTEKLNAQIRIYKDGSSLRINTGRNNYNSFISNENLNKLRISGILSEYEFEHAQNYIKQFEEQSGLKIEFSSGGEKYYDTVWGTLKENIVSRDIHNLYEKDKTIVAERVIDFITTIDNFKINCYDHNKI